MPALLRSTISALDGAETERPLTRAERSDQTAALVAALGREKNPDGVARLRDRVVMINTGVADAVAARYERRGVASDDLRQVAYEGLVKAVRRFDSALRNDFLTYAVPTIRGELQRHFRDRGWTVRPPRRLQEIQWRTGQVTQDLTHELGREPTPAEIASAANVSVSAYDEAMALTGCFHPASLDAPSAIDSGSQTVGDRLADDESERRYRAVEAQVTLAPALRRLSDRERRILYLRFVEDRTQHEIGQDIGVTQMQVSRLLTKILDKLHDDLERPGPPRVPLPTAS